MRALALVLVVGAAACGIDEDVGGPVRFPAGTVLYQGDDLWGRPLVHDGVVYNLVLGLGDDDEHGLIAIPTTGGAPRTLWQGAPHGIQGDDLAFADGRVFWAGERDEAFPSPEVVRSVSPDGGDATILGAVPGATVAGLSVEDGLVYAGSLRQVASLPTGGGSMRVLFSAPGSTEITKAAVYRNELYVAVDDGLWRVESGVQVPVHAAHATSNFSIVDDVAYLWGPEDVIVRFPLPGGPATELRVPGVPWEVVVGPDALYAAIAKGDDGRSEFQIIRVSLSDGSVSLLADVWWATTLALDDTALYVSTYDDAARAGFIGRIDLE